MTLRYRSTTAGETVIGNQFIFAGSQFMRISSIGMNDQVPGVPCVRIDGRLRGFVTILNMEDPVEVYSE